ncbi:thioredoxin 1 [Lachnospiraceae bacterium PF1-4]
MLVRTRRACPWTAHRLRPRLGGFIMLELTKENFEEEVLKADGYVFVDFYGDGCVPCQALMPKVHAFADTYGDKLKFTALNTTKARRLAIAQKVLGLPVMAVYKDGEKVQELVKDDCTEEAIEEMIKSYI